MQRTHAELRRFITNNFLYGRDCGFRDDESFLEMGIIDSTGLLELINFLEKHYRIKVEDADLIPENLDSIDQLCEFVERKTRGCSTVTSAVLERPAVS
ncbi:MAG: acyl carrier protein [Acidobacteriaceae bacterium]|nr:acyl carrier protein [Acidobacteriaceae bacterium]